MKIQLLSSEEKIFAEKNHYMVERFLSSNGLDESDFYDVVIFGYLHAVQEYLENPELSRYQFSTIAWRQMKDCMINELISQNRPKRNAPMADYHENYEKASLDDLLPNRMDVMAETIDNQNCLCILLSHLTPKEMEVIHLKADGYTYREIANYCGITMSGINSRIQRMRQRLRSMEFTRNTLL